MEQKKSGWAAEFRGLLGRLLPSEPPAPQPTDAAASADAAGAGAKAWSGDAHDMLRFLVKVGQVDGRFDAVERAFVVESLREAGHQVTEADLDVIAIETRFHGTDQFVRPFRDRSTEFREGLLRTGVLLAAASGRVATNEHKTLREACRELGLPRETLEQLVKEAIEARGNREG
jgi:tellurite resistance protein